MRNILKAAAVLAVPVLLFLAVLQTALPRQRFPLHEPERRQMQIAPVPPPPSPAVVCMAKSEFTTNAFKNDCLGLSFSSASLILGRINDGAPFVNISVPKAAYTMRVLAFEHKFQDLAAPERKTAFLNSARDSFARLHPKMKITRKEIITLGGAPAAYIGAEGNGAVERRFYFRTRGMWVELTMRSTDKNFTKKIKPVQQALLKTVKFH